MALNEKNGSSARDREKALRSKKLYWIAGTLFIALVLFTLYYSVYVSSQQSYYNERAFRLLSSMGDKFAQDIQTAGDVLTASASYEDKRGAAEYIHKVLHGRIDDQSFTITGWHKRDAPKMPTREGSLTLYLPDSSNSLRIRADYLEASPPALRRGNQAELGSVHLAAGDNPCSDGLSDIAVCATIDFAPLVRPAFHDLQEGFFDDVLIADARGPVLYQQSSVGVRIQNIAVLPTAATSLPSGGWFSRTAPSSTVAEPGASAFERSTFSALSQFSSEHDVELAGSTYKLYVQPMSVSLREKQQERRLVLCGLRTIKHSRGQMLAVPYTYLIWTILVLLTIFALGWPLLKFAYMSPKERLHGRDIVYLVGSIVLATALVSLIALNGSYKLTSDESSTTELKQLAEQINNHMNEELANALATLDALAHDDSLVRLASGKDWNQADFFHNHADFFPRHSLPYEYFRYFFVADEDGWQRLKFTVNQESTPKTNVKDEPFFHAVEDRDLSELRATKRETTYRFRMDPLYSPNTGEFLVVLARPWTKQAGPSLPDPGLKVAVLAIKFESVFNPVLPAGFGYAVVDLNGKVLFHNIPDRNLNENFIKESRADASVQALISEGATGSVDVNYLGTDKKLWITPVQGLSNPRLTLIVYKDSSYFTTVNMAIVLTFGVLVLLYAILPFCIVALAHVIRRGSYPLDAFWPNKEVKARYMGIFVANLMLSASFFLRYVSYGLARALIAILAVALAGALYPVLACHSNPRFRWAGNLLVLAALTTVSGASWTLLFVPVFAAQAFYRPWSKLERFFIRKVPLKYAYTSVAASILVTLVVVPSCGFFKVSYDYANRLFLQTQQLDLARKIENRGLAIEDYYLHLNAAGSSFEKHRLHETLDRYDFIFLNCPPKNPDPPQAAALHSGFAERMILDLTGQFPMNALGARLRELAQTSEPLPGLVWKSTPRVDICGGSVPSNRSLWLTNSDDLMIVSPYPMWPALDWRVRLLLAASILVIAAWVHFVPSRLFLLNMQKLPPLDKWRPERHETSPHLPEHVLLLGHPKSGKRTTVKRVDSVRLADLAEMATTGTWALIPDASEDVIALTHFEFGIDNAELNGNKLRLLEDLIYVRHKRIILLSTVDPIYYLASGSPETVVAGKEKDFATAMQLLDRWAALLTRFRKLTIDDITVPRFQRVIAKMLLLRTDTAFRELVDRVVKECDHTAQMRKIGAAILRLHRKNPGMSRDMLIQELLDRADSYYRVLWSTCTRDERLVLYQLAQDGWANPKNELAIQHLLRRGLILGSGLRIMNESFRHFIRRSQYHEEIALWEQEGEQSLWRSLRLSLGILAVSAAAWLLYSQQQLFNAVLGYVGALGAAAGVVFKLLSDLRGSRSAPMGDASSTR